MPVKQTITVILVLLLAGCEPQRQVNIVVHTPCMPAGQEISIWGELGIPGDSREGWLRMERMTCNLWSLAAQASPGDTVWFQLQALSPDANPLDTNGFPLKRWKFAVHADTTVEVAVDDWQPKHER